MNCLEAQSKIVAFIEDKLEDEEVLEFVRHIRSCDNCREELEIYYTLLVGMKELDEDRELSADFQTQMEEKLNQEYRRVRNRRKITRSSVLLMAAVLCAAGFLGYKQYRRVQYQQEQTAIKERQSEYYYLDCFGEALFHPKDYEVFDFSAYLSRSVKEDASSYYERLDLYLEEQEGESDIEETVTD